MKRLLILTLLVMGSALSWAYNFSAVAPSGQTLYYNIVGGHAEVVRQGNGPTYNNYVTGDLVIPSTVTYNGNTYNVTALAPAPNNNYGTFEGCSGLTSVTIPNSVTSICNYAFYNCSGLTSVVFNADSCTVPTYYDYLPFRNCSNISSFTFGDSVRYIPAYICYGMTGLTSVSIPNSVTSIGDKAFSGCSGLTSITIPNSVTSIGEYAFYLCSGLTGTLTIPNSVTSIGNYAFHGCSGLTSVVFNADSCNVPTNYEYRPFYGCTNISSFTFGDSVRYIPANICYGLTGVTSVTIPNSVTSIGSEAFRGCSGLTSVVFNAGSCDVPNSNSNRPFYGCTNISSFTFGDSVRYIPAYICYGLTGLTSVTIPNSVTSIRNSAFYNCSGLTSLTIGNSVASIGSCAFSGCSGLTEIHSEASVAPLLSDGCFAGVPNNIPVYIPCGSQMSYYSRWSYFSNFVEAAGFSFSATSADETMGSVTVLTQPTCQSPTAVINATPAAGYLFQQWNNGVTDNPYSLVVTSDTALSAIFVSANDSPCDTVYIYIHDTVYIHDTIYITGEGIDGADAMNAKVYTNCGQIVVERADGNMVTLYDVTGRVLATMQDDYSLLRFDTPTSGTYMIKIGSYPARKVVVIR